MEFKVNPKVLIPRPETEILVEQTVFITKQRKAMGETGMMSVLDVGTGSGVLAVSIASELPDAEIWATDVSEDALEVAKENAQRHGLDERINFIRSDLFSALDNQSKNFHVIVSNPPYIPSEDYDGLPPEVGNYEPRTALDGGEGGLFFINRLIHEAKDFLESDGWLLLEMAPFQTEKAMALAWQTGFYTECKIVKDYSHMDRVMMARRHQAMFPQSNALT